MSPSPPHPDCYDCIYRRALAGNTHSKCVHPETADFHQTEIAQLAALLGKRGAELLTHAANPAVSTLQIRAVPHGVAKGWFMWPLNYDPVWLQNCAGFSAIPESTVP